MVKAKNEAISNGWDYTPESTGGSGGGAKGVDKYGVPYTFYLKSGESTKVTFLHGLEQSVARLMCQVKWNGQTRGSETLPSLKSPGFGESCPLLDINHDWVAAYYGWLFTVVKHDDKYGDQVRLLVVKKRYKDMIADLSENSGGLAGKSFKVKRGTDPTSASIGENWFPAGENKGLLEEFAIIDYDTVLAPDVPRLNEIVSKLKAASQPAADESVPWDAK